MSESHKTLKKVLRIKHLKDKLALSVATIYNRLNPRSKYYDGSFPKPVKLSPGCVVWIESEVDAWLDDRIQASRRP